MTRSIGIERLGQAFLCVLLIAAKTPAHADEPSLGKRWEVTLNVRNWSALGDLQPVAGGSFDTVGFGLAGAMHWPVKQFDNSELLAGFDAGIMASDSSTPGVLNDLLVRQLFLSPSLKWMFGDNHRFSLDAGIGWHLLDIAEVDSGYGATGLEFEYWEDTAVAPYLGATWDVGAGTTKMAAVFTVALKVHFVDFGLAFDRDSLLPPTLGPSAGDLSGPVVVLQFGSAGR